ncbi:MAG: beta-1,6-N-acetylglucosaminyltransferase [Bacteroidales bacterium]|nr:beta-1,6-N-acetylglucosaminyltransferase [Bacteroidales bacterium]
MKLAFCYMVHKMSPVLEHSVKILSQIGDIIVHVDNRANIEDFHSIKDIVTFTENRIAVRWAGFPQIEADIELLRMADQKNNYDFISMMSGECMPIKTNSFIIDFFEKYKNKEFVSAVPDNDMIERRVKYIYPSYYSNKNRHLYQTLWILFTDRLPFIHRNPFLRKNPYFKSLPKLYKGANWFTISGNCNRYILNYLNDNPDYLKAFEKSHCGDEIIFHTIIFNSRFKDNLYLEKGCESQLRYIDWETGPEYPKVLDESDYKHLSDSLDLFARKISGRVELNKYEELFLK